jgi:nitrate/nitrite transporter NarK
MNDWTGLSGGILAGLGMAGLLIWALALLIITVTVAAWIARDATERRLQAPWAWALGAAFQPLIVLAVYFFTRETLGRRADERPQPQVAPGPV